MDEASDLIERLCVVAAMVMEDAIPLALMADQSTRTEERLDCLITAGRDIVVLAEAAQVIVRRVS